MTRSLAAVLVVLYLSLASGTNPISVRYPLEPIAFLDVKSTKNGQFSGQNLIKLCVVYLEIRSLLPLKPYIKMKADGL